MMLTRLAILLTSLTSLSADLDPSPPLLVFRQVVSLSSDPSVSPALGEAADLEAVLAGQVSSAVPGVTPTAPPS